jgi:aerobic carbon-monoxide dehydrogenase small subunit
MNELTVNGIKSSIADHYLGLMLIDYLREILNLRGTKRGCGIGACGTCTVLVDERPMRSCVVKLGRIIGRSVLTIEGMADQSGNLHPVQQSFIDAGAIQCGFCTPGMVLSAYALLLQNPEPSRTEIRKALRGNLCRCTGYQQIVDAVESASDALLKNR